MDKQFDYYYLQKKTDAQWITLAEGASVAALTAALADHLARLGAAQVRIAAATYDAEARDWRYQQLFYIDRGLIDIPITPAPATPAPITQTPTMQAPATQAPTPQTPTPQVKATEPEKTTAATPPPTEFRRESPPPNQNTDQNAGQNAGQSADLSAGQNLGQSGGRRNKAADMDRPEWLLYGQGATPARFEDAPPPRRSPLFKFIIAPVLIAAVLAFAAFGGLLYQGHPLALEWAEKLQISDYLSSLEKIGLNLTPPSKPGAEYPVEPATVGQAVKYSGTPDSLLGRWSASDCRRNFVEFTRTGYARTVGGTLATKPALVMETVEDDGHYYLRRSPLLVEHIRKLAPDAIQMVGTSETGGFQASPKRNRALSRCK